MRALRPDDERGRPERVLQREVFVVYVDLPEQRILWLHGNSWLLRDGNSLPVNGFEDLFAAATKQRVCNPLSQLNGITAIARFPDYTRAGGICNNSLQMQTSISNFCRSADWNLASAAQLVQQGTLACACRARPGIVKKGQMLASHRITGANLNPERTLSCSRTHHIGWNDLFDQFGFAQPIETGRGKNHRIVFTGFELSKTRIDVSAQRNNLQIRPNGFQLRLSS